MGERLIANQHYLNELQRNSKKSFDRLGNLVNRRF